MGDLARDCAGGACPGRGPRPPSRRRLALRSATNLPCASGVRVPAFRASCHRLLAAGDRFPATRRRGRGVFADQFGFTLIELLVVIIILGLLVAEIPEESIAELDIDATSIESGFKDRDEHLKSADWFDVGRYPDTGQGLDMLMRNPGTPNWSGPYLKRDVPKDPWGNAYKYRCCPGQHGDYDLWSEGADGAPGGEGENADVTSWDSGSK